jgi:hypothetical protein
VKSLKLFFLSLVIIFAIIGLLFSGVFVAMQFGWLNVRGTIEARNNSIILPLTDTPITPNLTSDTNSSSPETELTSPDYSCSEELDICQWTATREWSVVAGGLAKDSKIIERVSNETGVPARLIATVVVPEQIRFFTASREVFKRYFEPLKILGSLSQFSLGVSGIKQETARTIEQYANDPNTPFYPGEAISPLLSYPESTGQDSELFNRLTDEKDHYYSYLYTAIFLKQIMHQWEEAGYSIKDRPEVLSTLFNLGFYKSIPKEDPEAGGSTIIINDRDYTFGGLSYEFYYSGELSDIFPFETQNN